MSGEETQFWAVEVSRNGESIVRIETNCLSGRDISAEDARVIRMAAEHLQAFVGPESKAEDELRMPPGNAFPLLKYWQPCPECGGTKLRGHRARGCTVTWQPWPDEVKPPAEKESE